jgi:signal transduction histidine kinase
MHSPAPDADEEARLAALHNLGLLDTPAEPQFDRIVRIACSVAQVPISLISFVDSHRQWFKARHGLDVIETAREVSFCSHAILQEEPLVVTDTHEDPRFLRNPAVTGEPHVRFYAGFPIHAPEGARVGTLCVIDTQPRILSAQQHESLVDLATLVDAELLARRVNVATRAASIGIHERMTASGEMWWSDSMWRIYGQDPVNFRPSLEAWLPLVHPADRDRVRAHIGDAEQPRPAASLRYRIVRPDGVIRHLHSIASMIEPKDGARGRIAGITLDVTEQAEAEELFSRQQSLLRENSHQAGRAEVAADVLHSVGNAVNSVGVSHGMIRRHLNGLRLEQLDRATRLIRENRASLGSYLVNDEHGRHLPDYLPALSAQIAANVSAILAELNTTDELLEQLRDIVSAQQGWAHSGNLREPVDLKELLDAAIEERGLESADVEVVRCYEAMAPITTDRHKLRRILDSLLSNARDAVLAIDVPVRRITVRLGRDGDAVLIIIEDSGGGMSPEVLSQLWQFGFSTKQDGNGFSLHNSANAAREIGATIVAQSDGVNTGARFILRLPA